ncbi:uncharacterized protein LOC116854146 isoform X2 [Odontomachus brunneus]|nr:uncharacterized protein LOC116854146 isoform X2 [Odontomachus brunneus]
MLCVCLLESNKYENLWNAFIRLIALKSTYGNAFPATYYALAKIYMKMYIFFSAAEEIRQGISFLYTHAPFDSYFIPQTTSIIEETTRIGLLFKLNIIRNDCVLLNNPDAICYLDSKCKNHLPSIIAKISGQETNKAIYLKDPHFKGMVTLICSNHIPCLLQYHWICWEYLKELNDIIDNRDIFNINCFNKKCKTERIPNKFMQIEVIGKDGELVETFISKNKPKKSNSIMKVVTDIDAKGKSKFVTCRTVPISQIKRKNIEEASEESPEKREIFNTYINSIQKVLDDYEQQCGTKKKVTFRTLDEITEKDDSSKSFAIYKRKDKDIDEISTATNVSFDDDQSFEEYTDEELIVLNKYIDEYIKDSTSKQKQPSVTKNYDGAAKLTSEFEFISANDYISKSLHNKSDSCSSKKVKPKHLEDFDQSLTKNLNSSASSKSSKARNQNSNKTSPFKHSFSEIINKMKKNVEKSMEKLKPVFFKFVTMENNKSLSTKYLSNNEERESEKGESTGCNKTVTGATNFQEHNVKRKISFDSCTHDENIENNNDTVHKSHHHTADGNLERNLVEDLDKIEIANQESEPLLLNKSKTFINNLKIKNIFKSPYNHSPRSKSRSQYILGHEYYIHLLDNAAQLEEKKDIINRQEAVIQDLSEKIERLTSELTILKHQFRVDDLVLEQKIVGSSLQKFRLLISESVREHKQTLKNYYEENMEKENKKIKEEYEKIILKYEQRNIALHTNLEIKEKEFIYLSSKLESTNKEYLDFKTEILTKRLTDQYNKSNLLINKNIYFYENALNIMKIIERIFNAIVGEKLSYVAQELQSWQDNITFLRKELKNCQEAYMHGTIQLKKKEYIDKINDIPWVNYTAPEISNTILSSYVFNAFIEFYNKLMEKCCQDKSSLPQQIPSIDIIKDLLITVEAIVHRTNNDDMNQVSTEDAETSELQANKENNMCKQHSADDKHEDILASQYKCQEKERTEYEKQQDNDILTLTLRDIYYYKNRYRKSEECEGHNINDITDCKEEIDEEVTTSEMNLVSDKVANKSDEDINKKEIVNEVNKANNKIEIIMKLNDDCDSMENFSPKGKKSEGIIITELSDDNDNMENLSSKENKSEGVIITKLSDDNNSMENLSPKGKKSEGIIITKLNDNNDSMKNLSPKREKSKGIIIMELSSDSDSMKNFSPKGKKSEGVIITELSDDRDSMKNIFFKKKKSDIVIYDGKQINEGVTISEVTASETNRASDEGPTLDKANEVNDEKIIDKLHGGIERITHELVDSDIDEMITSELNENNKIILSGCYSNKDSDSDEENLPEENKSNILTYYKTLINEKYMLPLKHYDSDLWNNLTQGTIQNQFEVITVNNKITILTNSNKLVSKRKSICSKKINKNIFNKNKKHIEKEMNAINDLLSTMLQNFPNLASTEILNGIMTMKDTGMIISKVSQEFVIKELHYLITKANAHGIPLFTKNQIKEIKLNN